MPLSNIALFLVSTLVAIRYDEPIDTIDQMVESGLPFGVLENSAIGGLPYMTST